MMLTDTLPNASTIFSTSPIAPSTVHPEHLYEQGRLLVERGFFARALPLFEEAHRRWPRDRRFQSYLGLCLAESGKKVGIAIALCERAARADFLSPELFCNLGRVAEIAGDRRRAHAAYCHGLALDAEDPELRRNMVQLGVRKPPVVPFLPRQHAVNRLSGQLLCKLGLR
ncbi:MAG: tetratricopeptide repeat protein [Candidatus Eiseniibacteriota bacterium]|jgi:Flp pilus assembly protein TadD